MKKQVIRNKGTGKSRLGGIAAMILFAFSFLPSAFPQPPPYGEPILLNLDRAQRSTPPLDQNTTNPPAFYVGDDVEMDVSLFSSGQLIQTNMIVKYTNLEMQIFASQNDTNPPRMQLIVTNTAFFTNLFSAGAAPYGTNNYPTNFQAQFYWPGDLTQLSLNGNASQYFWLRCFATGTNGDIVTFGEGPIQVLNAPISAISPALTFGLSQVIVTNSTSVLSSPTNFFAANSNLLNQSVSPILGGALWVSNFGGWTMIASNYWASLGTNGMGWTFATNSGLQLGSNFTGWLPEYLLSMQQPFTNQELWMGAFLDGVYFHASHDGMAAIGTGTNGGWFPYLAVENDEAQDNGLYFNCNPTSSNLVSIITSSRTGLSPNLTIASLGQMAIESGGGPLQLYSGTGHVGMGNSSNATESLEITNYDANEVGIRIDNGAGTGGGVGALELFQFGASGNGTRGSTNAGWISAGGQGGLTLNASNGAIQLQINSATLGILTPSNLLLYGSLQASNVNAGNTLNVGTNLSSVGGYQANITANNIAAMRVAATNAVADGGALFDLAALDAGQSATYRAYMLNPTLNGVMFGFNGSNENFQVSPGVGILSNGYPSISVAQNGWVGIGTGAPADLVHVLGGNSGGFLYSTIDWDSGTSGSGFQIETAANTGNVATYLNAYTGGATVGLNLTLKPGAGLGVNTESPNTMLDVNGSGVVSNNFTVYGNTTLSQPSAFAGFTLTYGAATNTAGNILVDQTVTNALNAQMGILSTNATNYAASILQNSFNGAPLTNWIGVLTTNLTNYAQSEAIGEAQIADTYALAVIGVTATNATNFAGALSTNATNYAAAQAIAAVSSAEAYAALLGTTLTNWAGVLSTNATNWASSLIAGSFSGTALTNLLLAAGSNLTNWAGTLSTNATNFATGSQWGESTRTLSNLQANIIVNSAGQITNCAVVISNSGGYTVLTSNWFGRLGTNGSSLVLDTNGLMRLTNSAVNWMLLGGTGLSNYGSFYLNSVQIASGGGVTLPAPLQANGGINVGAGAITNSAAYYNPATIALSGPNPNLDWSLGSVYSYSLGGNEAVSFINVPDAGSVTFFVTNTASYTVSFSAPAGMAMHWPGKTQPTATPAGLDVYTFVRSGAVIASSVVQNF